MSAIQDLAWRAARKVRRLAREVLSKPVANMAPAETQIPPLSLVELRSLEAFKRLLDTWKSPARPVSEIAGGSWKVPGFCAVSRSQTEFVMDELYADRSGQAIAYNWRERMVCGCCGLNSRQRAAIQLCEATVCQSDMSSVWITEQLTPVYRILKPRFSSLIGSEFLGDSLASGTINESGIRHEDVTSSSFTDGSLDLILSFDVFEHVPDPMLAFKECARVLRPGGVLLFTVPFLSLDAETRVRARLEGSEVVHLMEPQYHGDPVHPDKGVLCYQEFGWDILEKLRDAGFDDASVLVYESAELGHLGGPQIMLKAMKGAPSPGAASAGVAGHKPAPAWHEASRLLHSPQLGEYAWHSFAVDPEISTVSSAHLESLRKVIKRHLNPQIQHPRILELGAYRHHTGYLLEQHEGAKVVLSDISGKSLEGGKRGARAAGLSASPELVAADFHDLPFQTGAFDVVFVASSVHHTLNPEQVLAEMLRVLSPGGVLLLENEPCAREFCFYQFRSNRSDSFTQFERELDLRGLLATVSSPFWGSRSEELFGMVENDRIPLSLYMQAVRSGGSILEYRADPGPLMRQLEFWVESQAGKQGAADRIAQRLKAELMAVAPALGPVEKRLGFGLPSWGDILLVSERTQRLLDARSAFSDLDDWRVQLFGGALRAVVRGTGLVRAEASNWPPFSRDMIQRGDVWHENQAHAGNASRLAQPLLPDVFDPTQTESSSVHLPDSEWFTVQEDIGTVSWLPRGCAASILLPECETESALLIRYYAVPGDRPFVIEVTCAGVHLETHEVLLQESRLLRVLLAPRSAQVRLQLRPMDAGAPLTGQEIRLSVVQMLPLQSP